MPVCKAKFADAVKTGSGQYYIVLLGSITGLYHLFRRIILAVGFVARPEQICQSFNINVHLLFWIVFSGPAPSTTMKEVFTLESRPKLVKTRVWIHHLRPKLDCPTAFVCVCVDLPQIVYYKDSDARLLKIHQNCTEMLGCLHVTNLLDAMFSDFSGEEMPLSLAETSSEFVYELAPSVVCPFAPFLGAS